MPVSDILEIKTKNIQSIIDAARFAEYTTKKELTEKTGLSGATVSNICNELAQAGVFTYQKDNTHSIGRNPQNITFNYHDFWVICVNIQLKGIITMTAVDGRNQIVLNKTYVIDENWTADQILAFANEKYYEDFCGVLSENTKIIGIGIAVSGVYDIKENTLICSTIPQFENMDIKSIVIEKYGIPVYVNNAANLCALSMVDKGDNYRNAAYLHCSESIGLGVLVENNLLYGQNGYAGAICSPLGNGNHSKISTDEILNAYYLKEQKDKNVARKNFKQDIENGNEKAALIAENVGSLIGTKLGAISCIFDPSVIVIGGEIVELKCVLEPVVLKKLEEIKEPWRVKTPSIIWDDNSDSSISKGLAKKIFAEWRPLWL